MATRTIGIVTGATVLMLVYQAAQAAGPAGFMVGFQASFRIAAAIPTVLIILELRRYFVPRS